MLAKAPLKLPESLQYFKKERLLFASERMRCPKSAPFSVRAAYTRKPTGTPGAYQLIDDDTGDKFIVWGGADDAPDSPIPPKKILSWKPGNARSRQHVEKKGNMQGTRMGGVEPTISTVNGGKTTPSAGIFSASFGRLKAQRVRALIKKSPRIKQENIDSRRLDNEDMLSDQSDGSDSEEEFVVREHGYKGSMLTAAREQIAKDNVLGNEMIPDTNHSYAIPKYNRKPVLEDQSTSVKARGGNSVVTERNVAVPRAASSLRGWSNSSSYQKTMVDLTYPSKQRKKMSADGGFFSRKSFKDLGCSEDMIESLRAQLFIRPSHIQAMAYVPVSKGKSCIIADQSGSGKTLAYLAPVIQRLRQEELQGLSKSSPRSPRVVILVPTTELASQVLNNCRSISKFGVPFRSMVATGGFRQKTQLENLQQDLDVLIATPGRFIFLLQEGLLQLTNLKCAVLDEVDILFGDEGFEQVLQSLIYSVPMTTQYLFVTATLPLDIYNKLVQVFPDCEAVMGPGMHRTSSGLEEALVDCSGDDGEEKTPETAFLNKKSALLQIVEETPVPKTIIFCNKIETCRKVENVLKRIDRKGLRLRVLPFHAAVAQELRLANMKEFLSSQSKDCMFLICTDRASRGIDFANVDHVVLFDFPRDPSEYVRRVGRTARGAGGKGRAFAFVVGKQVSLARRIMERNQKGHPLHDVPAAYELVNSTL
ncbi:DEAD-box ATP-dependent RNA helicase 50 isoform X2 [Magnolia sinica]|uniref:DEAD-box ATP-dependent RNA helicase 50 isoform X2 n=1 Tax=Magnolia sinica TaxID=86752 RepID=UPI002658DD04|nr:DEAD-box ATP-dependent RNA helicase 50 isoform X2 [Magnolia sinica]